MQEAINTYQKAPETLAECHALIASLLSAVNQKEAALTQKVAELNQKAVELNQKEALIAAQAQAIDVSLQERDALQTQIDEHTKTIERLLGIHQKRRERFDRPRPLLEMLDEHELNAEDEAIVEAITEVQENLDVLAEQVAVRTAKPRKKRSFSAPSHWPRVEVPYRETNPAISQCDEHGPREIMGYDVREKMVMTPAKFYVEQTRIPKYKCQGHPECGIKQQAAPQGLVKGDKIDTSIAAQIVVQKHMHHVPLYRNEDIFASSGWTVARGTLLNVLCSMAYLLEGLYDHFRKQMVANSSLIATDDTVVKLILPDYIPPPKPDDPWSQRVHEVLTEAFQKNKSSVSARMWAYRGIEASPWNVFDFTISRHRDGPERFLQGFEKGILLGDCYAGYESLRIAKGGCFQRAACNAHARRKLHDSLKNHPKESALLLAIYRELYDVESLIQDMPAETVLAKRQEFSVPLFARMKDAIDSFRRTGQVLPKSQLGKALSYIENHWATLRTYLQDGRCPIDNNLAEQLMKHTATGRKNWLFIGSIEAGYRAAILATICSTAHRHHLDVYAYVKQVADRLLAGDRNYESMQPENWAQEHPEHIRTYRKEESRYAADRKKRTRVTDRRDAASRRRKLSS